MEIKAELKQPYTDEERANFIVENNHNLGYEIKETEKALEAWGFTDEEKQQQAKLARIAEIKYELSEIDLKSIRPARAGETDRLAELEAQAVKLRAELKTLYLDVNNLEKIKQENPDIFDIEANEL